MKQFSSRLISLRKEKQMTQTDVANVIGKQRSTVSGYEIEGKEPDFETLCFLAGYFGVTTDYLLGRDDERAHADVVFRNDNANFKKHYDKLPPELKAKVTSIFDDFYVLLNRDMQAERGDRLTHYRDLIARLRSGRGEIKKQIENTANLRDPQYLSQLMEMENELKGDVAKILDGLMQADLDYVLGNKKNRPSRAHCKA